MQPEPDSWFFLLVFWLVLLFVLVVWFAAACLGCQAHLTYPLSEFDSVTCVSRHTQRPCPCKKIKQGGTAQALLRHFCVVGALPKC